MNALFISLYIFVLVVVFLLLYFIIKWLRDYVEIIDSLIDAIGIVFILYCLYSVLCYCLWAIPNWKFFFSYKFDVSELKFTLLGIKLLAFFGTISDILTTIEKKHSNEIKNMRSHYEKKINNIEEYYRNRIAIKSDENAVLREKLEYFTNIHEDSANLNKTKNSDEREIEE